MDLQPDFAAQYENATFRRVFLSSTVYDLRRERRLLKETIEAIRTDADISFKCDASEFPDFPVSLSDIRGKHSYQLCIDAVHKSNIFVLLLKKRYGAAIIPFDDRSVSITEREYLEARRCGSPVIVFLDERTWNARSRWRAGRPQKFVPPKQLELFHFIERIQGRPSNPQPNWMTIYRGDKDLKIRLESMLGGFDDSKFVADVTVPDNSLIEVNQMFTKRWRFRNAGVIAWTERYLQEENPSTPGLVPLKSNIDIPPTLPGQEIEIAITFRAPATPGTYVSYWKMRDRNGQYVFPQKEGLSCRVLVRRNVLGFPNVG